MEQIKVLLVDDHGMVREGLRAMLSLNQDIQVVGEAVDGREAIARARACAPNVVVMVCPLPTSRTVKKATSATKTSREVWKRLPQTAGSKSDKPATSQK